MVYVSKTRAAGGSIKPGVERSGTPGMMKSKKTQRAKRAIAQSYDLLSMSGCRPTSWALGFYSNDPGVPLRSTPGFMLPPRFAGLRQTFNDLFRGSYKFSLPNLSNSPP
jgi:hypothetical protein